ncbi:PH domain-containing protein [Dactylosporangium sp. NPDC051541]|uniref:PH domain-containing protein n=1 Tax=Dactylosporangium sp. NPDC051541 TaxID=3363977 RepID=UPI0037B37C4A
MSQQIKVKFRRSAALAVAGAITVIGGIPLLAESVWFLPLLLIPLAIAVWAWRAGTDADERGFTVRALFGHRTVPWNAVDGLVTDGNTVQARLANGHLVQLDAVRPADLPRLIKASGQDLQPDRPTTHPGTPDSEATDPDPAELDAPEPDASEPDATAPDALDADATELDATEPDATAPDAAEDTSQPAATEDRPQPGPVQNSRQLDAVADSPQPTK